MATVIHPDGHGEVLNGAGKKGVLTLKQMQQAVGGYIEFVSPYTDVKHLCIANEEGLLKRMEPNRAASLVMGRPLVGPVIFAEPWEVE